VGERNSVRFTAAELAEIRHVFRQRIATPPKPKARRKPNLEPRRLTTVLTRDPGYDDGDILTTRRVADVFGVSTNIVRGWAEAGTLPSFRTLGGHRRFRWGEIRRSIRPGL
jgi:excisionase family DNA binding protein